MRLNSLRLRGITEAFPNEDCVDFDSLGEGLIAIVGENGAGKSTLIGSVFAALFRQLPGQKRSLYDFATHPQPEIDLTFSVNGARYRSLLKIDPKSRQMESYLFNGDGKPLTNGKKEPFEEFVRRIAGTPDFFLSSIFSSQKRTGMEYIRMLRRAMDLGGFHQVIFICHTPLVWELADNILSVRGGYVVIGDRGVATRTGK